MINQYAGAVNPLDSNKQTVIERPEIPKRTTLPTVQESQEKVAGISSNQEEVKVRTPQEYSRQSLGVPVTESEWRLISESAISSENPQEELQRYASAITFAREYNVPVSTAMQNLDAFTEYQTGKKFVPNKTATTAIADSFRMGKLTVERSELAMQFMDLHQKGEDVSDIAQRMAEIDKDIEANQDNLPRNIATRLLKLGAQILPYTLDVALAGAKGGIATAASVAALASAAGVPLAATGVGAIPAAGAYAATVGSAYAVGQTTFSVQRTRELQKGVAYYDMINAGVDKNIAYNISEVEGTLYGVIETLFNQIGGVALKATGIDDIAGKVASNLMGKLTANGTLGAVGQAISRYLLSGLGEGIEETTQSLTTSAREEITYLLTGIIPEGSKSAVEKAIDEGIQGFIGGLILGLPTSGISTAIDIQQAKDINNFAKQTPSKEAFVRSMEKTKPEDITATDWNAAMATTWQRNNTNRKPSVIASEETAVNELDAGKGKKPSGTVRRLTSGDLYTQESDNITTDTEGAEYHSLKIGDPVTAARYGTIDYSIKDNTLTINDVLVRDGYEEIRKEAILKLTREYEGYNVEWDAKGENLQAIKDDIIASNPRGQESGLQYFDGITNVDERVKVESTIKEYFPKLNAVETSLAATILQLRAEAKGMKVDNYMSQYGQNGKLFGSAEDLGVDMTGKKGATDFSTFENEVKAVIYAGEKADFSTFSHEIFHLFRREMDQSQQLEEALTNASKEDLEKYIKNHKNVFAGETFKGMSAKEIVEAVSEFGNEWSRIQEEVVARLYESYFLDGTTGSPKLANVFNRIAQWMSKIYQAIRGRIDLDKRIVEVFDSLLDSDSPIAKMARENKTEKTKSSVSDVAQKDILHQEDAVYKTEYETVLKQYQDSDQWMKAPNGKDTNLTEKQWVQVRTSSFKAWFGDWENDPENASKVVDENGEPKVVYHGTKKEFTTFNTKKTATPQFWFTDTKELIEKGEVGASGNGAIIDAYLDIKNPAGWKEEDNLGIQQIIDRGFDGKILEDGDEKTYVVFESTQIKSATDNNGMFDSNNPNILFQEDGKPVTITDFPNRPDIDEIQEKYKDDPSANIFKKMIEENRVWHKELEEWLKGKPDLLQFGDEKRVAVIHKNTRPDEGHWRVSTFGKHNDEWIPSGHSSFDTKIKAIIFGIGSKDYRPDILFQESIDNRYFEALEVGDMETAQKIVDDQARKKGYISNNDFRMSHQAPNGHDDFSVNLANIKDTDLIPKDFWDHPSWYTSDDREMRAFYKVKDAIDRYERNGKAKIRLYRAIPKNVKEDMFRNGDWVTPDRDYAVDEGLGIPEGYRIIWHSVPIEHVWWDVNSIAELGYDDGNEYAYRNTLNNRKLTDAIVRDVDGAIVPPSKRFNYRSNTLFQDETDFTNRQLEIARESDSWEDFRDNYIIDVGFDFDVEVPEDEQWYKDVFNEANGISEEAILEDVPETTRVKMQTEQQKDDYFSELMEDDAELTKFVSEMGMVLIDKTYEHNGPQDQEEYDEMNRLTDLRYRIEHEVSPFIMSNALRGTTTKAFSEKAIKSMRTMMSDSKTRFYRDLYAETMQDKDLKPSVIDERLPGIDEPGYEELESLSITERIRMADDIEAEDLKKMILKGDELFAGQAEKVITKMDRDISTLNNKISKLETEIEEKSSSMNDKERELSIIYQKMSDAKRDLNKETRRLRKQSNADPKYQIDMTDSYALENKIKELQDQIRKLRTSDKVKATVKRQEALAKLKDELTSKYNERNDARKVREYKIKLARRIMVKPSDAVDYEYRQRIFQIQAMLDPKFRRDSVVLDGERMDIEDAKNLFEGSSDEELFNALGERAYNRIKGITKPLNDWTLAELEGVVEVVADLRSEGRRIWEAKEEQKRIIADNYRIAMIRSVLQSGKYQSRPLAGSLDDTKEKRSAKEKLRAVRYAGLDAARLAQLIDNGDKGAAFELLIRQRRRLQSMEWSNIEKRSKPVVKLMKDLEISPEKLYEKVPITLPGGMTANVSYSYLMYAYLSQFNEDNRNAVAYGVLVSAEEKQAMQHDSVQIKKLGNARYNHLLEVAESQLGVNDEKSSYWKILEAIREDFNSQAPRINDVAIREYNQPMRSTENYLPMHRLGVTGEDLAANIMDDLFNANAGDLPTGVSRGFMKDRIKISPDRQSEINMDLFGVWDKSMRQHEHMIAFAEYGRMLNRVFKNKNDSVRDLRSIMSQSYGNAMMDDIDEYINEIVNPDSFNRMQAGDKLLRAMRGNLGAAYLAWKFSGLVLQGITSPMPFLSDIKAPHLIKGFSDLSLHPIETWRFITDHSQMMKNRSMNPILQLISDRAKESTTNKLSKFNKRQQEIGSLGLTWVDRWSVSGGWMGAYRQKMAELQNAEGLSTQQREIQASEYADEVVLRVQPTGDRLELSPFYKMGGEAMKIVTQFQTSLNVLWKNLTFDVPWMVKRSMNKELPAEVRKAEFGRAIGQIVGYTLAGALLGAVAEGYDDDDDTRKEKVLKWLYWSTTQFSESTMIFGNEVDDVMKSLITGDKPSFFGQDMFPAASSFFDGLVDITQENWGRAAKNMSEGFGYFTGLPVSGTKQIERVVNEGPGAFLGRRK